MGHLHLMLKIVRIIIVIRLWRIRCCLVRMGLVRIVGLVGVIMRVGARWGRLQGVREKNIIIRVWIRRIIILVRNFLGIRLWILLRRKVDVALRSMCFFLYLDLREKIIVVRDLHLLGLDWQKMVVWKVKENGNFDLF